MINEAAAWDKKQQRQRREQFSERSASWFCWGALEMLVAGQGLRPAHFNRAWPSPGRPSNVSRIDYASTGTRIVCFGCRYSPIQ